MLRRDFFKRTVAAVTALFGGAATVAAATPTATSTAVPRVRGLTPMPPRRQVEAIKVFRLGNPAKHRALVRERFAEAIAQDKVIPFQAVRPRPELIDWFDQEPGDMLVGVRPDGRVECWEATSEGFWTDHRSWGWVETVQMRPGSDLYYNSLDDAKMALMGYAVDDFKAQLRPRP